MRIWEGSQAGQIDLILVNWGWTDGTQSRSQWSLYLASRSNLLALCQCCRDGVGFRPGILQACSSARLLIQRDFFQAGGRLDVMRSLPSRLVSIE